MKTSLNLSYHFSYFLLFTFLFTSCEIQGDKLKENRNQRNDSIRYLIQIAQNTSIKKDERLQVLNRVNEFLIIESNDSSKSTTLLKIADIYFSLNEDSLFLEKNEEAFKLAQKEGNLKVIAEYYWNKGNYFSNSEVLDSAFLQYHRAHELYDSINHTYYKSKMAFNMSFIQFRLNNYIESEILVISAIEGFKKMNKYLNLYLSYNRLLLLDKENGDFKSALNHYNLAKEYLIEANISGFDKEKLLNNLSLVYQKQKEYPLAIEALDQALENEELQVKDPNLYAKLIDNRAYCRFLSGESDKVYDDFKRALDIRDSINNRAGVGISNMHLAEFYLASADSTRALDKARKSNDLAQSLGLNRDVLSSLLLLSKADPSHATIYMEDYISLNDSLLISERKLRNKFARIEYETEGYIAANKDLRKQNVWISLTSVLSIASLGLLFFGYRQRSKHRTLMLEHKQQSANEEIYDLMLKQQNREEEGRLKERLRISEELHDGVLARLFSVRMGLGFFQLAKTSDESSRFNKFMKELQGVEKEIRSVSHALKREELSSKKDFPKLLEELLKDQSRLGNFKYELDADPSIAWNLVDDKIKINLYRIVQEGIYNIIKHAACSSVSVSLKRKKNEVQLSIVDNGVGFDTKEKRKGIGLKNIKSRAQTIGAVINILSSPKNGTRIKLTIATKTLYHESVS